MAANVPPKIKPLNFNIPVTDGKGQMHPQFQQQMVALAQRVNSPVSTSAPATSASPGIPLSLATDGTFLYINLGGVWKRITLSAF
jgi:hypothetical protein